MDPLTICIIYYSSVIVIGSITNYYISIYLSDAIYKVVESVFHAITYMFYF